MSSQADWNAGAQRRLAEPDRKEAESHESDDESAWMDEEADRKELK